MKKVNQITFSLRVVYKSLKCFAKMKHEKIVCLQIVVKKKVCFGTQGKKIIWFWMSEINCMCRPNCWPISLTTADHKILSFIWANCLQSVTGKLISSHKQLVKVTGYIHAPNNSPHCHTPLPSNNWKIITLAHWSKQTDRSLLFRS